MCGRTVLVEQVTLRVDHATEVLDRLCVTCCVRLLVVKCGLKVSNLLLAHGVILKRIRIRHLIAHRYRVAALLLG